MADLASIAESQIGTQEDARHQNEGSAILKYQQATNLDGQGWPWCAAFVSWCVQQWENADNLFLPKPRIASAFGLIDWARENKFLVFSAFNSAFDAQRNDIVVYAFSHCGIVSSAARDLFQAIEGNSNTDGSRDGFEVARRPRKYSSVSRFIRLQV